MLYSARSCRIRINRIVGLFQETRRPAAPPASVQASLSTLSAEQYRLEPWPGNKSSTSHLHPFGAGIRTMATSIPIVPPSDAAVDLIESAKRKAAFRAVEDHFQSSFRYVGIGSGSTIIYGVEAIKEVLQKNPPPAGQIPLFVPTGFQSRKVIESAGLISIAFDSLPEDVMLDVAFDGADEVDDELNCIKGGGACLFQEKLVATRSKRFICIAGV